jgi:hypothetical protein
MRERAERRVCGSSQRQVHVLMQLALALTVLGGIPEAIALFNASHPVDAPATILAASDSDADVDLDLPPRARSNPQGTSRLPRSMRMPDTTKVPPGGYDPKRISHFWQHYHGARHEKEKTGTHRSKG